MSWQSEVMRLSTGLNAERPDAFIPCKRTSKSSSLKNDIAAAKDFGYWGASSCAPLVSVSKIGLSTTFANLKNSCMSQACVLADDLSCLPLRMRMKISHE